MLSKRYKSTEVDRRIWVHVPSGTPWSTSSDTDQVVESILSAIYVHIYKYTKAIVTFRSHKTYRIPSREILLKRHKTTQTKPNLVCAFRKVNIALVFW